MSSIVLPSRGQCIEVTENLQLCQCPSFVSTLDQLICGWCGHGIHAHRDYVSMVVHECIAMNCAAYYPKTPRVLACTCSASLIEHMPVWNAYRSLTPLPSGTDVDNAFPSNVNGTSTSDTANIPFTPIPMPSPSTNDAPIYSYGEILAPAPQPVIQTAIMSQIDAHSHSEVENSYIAQYQNDNSSVINNVQDSSARFHENYSTAYVPVHGAETWTGQLE